MAKLTEYPAATSFDSGDILIKDGTNGTKKISVDDASVNFIEIANQTVSLSQIVALDDCVLIANDTDGVRKMLVTDIGGNGGGIDYNINEQNTGLKWIDGKPIYQKTIDFGNLPNSNEKNVNSGVSDIESLINIDGVVKWPSGYQVSINANNIDDAIFVFALKSNGDISCTTYIDRSDLTAIITIKYTKTTDQPSPPVIVVA